MREFFRFPKKDDFKPEIKESLDRKNRQPLGNLPEDEDDLRVNQNDPRHRYKTSDDLVDDSYLTFGEEVEESAEEPNEEIEDEKLVGEEVDLEEIYNESKLKTEASEYSDFSESANLDKPEEVEVELDEVENKKKDLENIAVKPLKDERRGMGGKTDYYDIKKVKNYNLKTEPENKTQRRLRGEIKNFIDKNI